jgi:hypothetical protein
MVAVSLIAGIGLLLIGLVAVGFGIPVKEFSFGNTLILVGAVAACTGILVLGLGAVIRELRNIARQLGATAELRPASRSPPAALGEQAPQDGGFLFSRDQPAEYAGSAEPAPPWPQVGSRDREPVATPEPVEAAAAVKPRRNLLFSSSSRRERDQARAAEVSPPAPESGEAQPAIFEDTRPKPERMRADATSPRRPGRAPSTFAEAGVGAPGADRFSPAARREEPPPVTVLKSGVVDGMAYSLYSDGSIEAQMPEGMMRFASIDELRAHLDQRP